MKKIILTAIISSTASIAVGFYLGISSEVKEQESIYCNVYKVYSDGILYSLKSSDIEIAPEAKSRLISELRTTNGELKRCLDMNLDLNQQIKKSNNEANEYLQSL
jgi:hypothetical protein